MILQRGRERRAVQNAMKQFRAEDRRTKETPSWENWAQRALVRSRALTLVALCEAMLDANMSEEQVAAILLAAKI